MEVVAAIDRFLVGELSSPHYYTPIPKTKPVTASSKEHTLKALRTFFTDCQQWGWLQVHFNPNTAFAIPKSIQRSMGTNPKVIADEVWAKLMWGRAQPYG